MTHLGTEIWIIINILGLKFKAIQASRGMKAVEVRRIYLYGSKHFICPVCYVWATPIGKVSLHLPGVIRDNQESLFERMLDIFIQ